MFVPKTNAVKKGEGNGLVAIAIDKDKGSQNALKWTVENVVTKGQTVILVHVVHKTPSYHSSPNLDADPSQHKRQLEKLTKDIFLTFHCFCTCKDIQCLDVVLEEPDIVRGIIEYVSQSAIETLVLGSPSRHGFMRKFKADVPSGVSKGAPDFCTVYVISKNKVSSVRNATRSPPFTSPLISQLKNQNEESETPNRHSSYSLRDKMSFKPRPSVEEPLKSPFSRGRGFNGNWSESETDISFVSSGRPSTDRSSMLLDFPDSCKTSSRLSNGSDQSLGSMRSSIRFTDKNHLHDFSFVSQDSARTSCSCSSQNLEDVESQMRRLKLELKQTMEMYSTACKEALTAKQQATELQRWKLAEARRLEEAKFAEEAALSAVEKEKAKCKAATEAAEAAKRIAELEAQKRVSVETKIIKDSDGTTMEAENMDLRYRRYTIEEIEIATEFFAQHRKIGEGGYGPVYKCHLDHTPVAVKVLRPDAAQGRSQFQQEVGVLSCIRHPNMVLLLGACPEYGVIVYEYMANGSLDDRIFQRGNTPPLPWQHRFRIAAEIATGLLFLHQSKPEPIVHRDLKPGNILLDHNFVSKIGDVGLARLVPAVAENVTQYRMTSTAGTFCYIDPEYQQTGMLGVKSDVYSLGIMLLQMITAKQPMGLAHYVERAIEQGTFKDMLDPSVPDWPYEEALSFAKLAVQCAELRRKDRPDLGTLVLPELNRLRDLADESINHFLLGGAFSSPGQMSHEVMSDPQPVHSGSSKSNSSTTLETENPTESTPEP